MEIKATFKSRLSGVLPIVYRDIESEADLDGKKILHAHAYCFCNDKLVVVNNGVHGWQPPGGGIEPNESIQDAVAREVKEETNMRVLKQRIIGYQDISEPHRITSQTRSVCLVEPYGDFVSDPDGDVMEIKLIDPKDYKQYFDWGEIGDRIMERALQIKAEMSS